MGTSKLTRNPLAYLAIILLIYTVYDYMEHIGRKGSIFAEHPWYWLFFSLSAFTSLIIVVWGLKQVLQKLFKQKSLLIEVAAIGIWLALYLTLLGPLFDWTLWPYGDLNFNFKFGPFLLLLAGYFILRMVINLALRQKLLLSN